MWLPMNLVSCFTKPKNEDRPSPARHSDSGPAHSGELRNPVALLRESCAMKTYFPMVLMALILAFAINRLTYRVAKLEQANRAAMFKEPVVELRP